MRSGKDKIGIFCLWSSVVGFLIMSVSFLLMPVEKLRLLPGLLFWSGLVLGVVFQIVLESRRRKFFTICNADRRKMQKPRSGILTFGSNSLAVITDIALAVSVISTVLVFAFTGGYGYLCFVCIAITLLAFCLHCIFNGRNYFYVNNQSKIRQALENKKASITERKRERNENS